MITDESEDLIICNLGRLPILAPDATRAARHRGRCCAAIARVHEQAGSSSRASSVAAVVETVLIGALCAAYLAGVAHDVLRLYGVR